MERYIYISDKVKDHSLLEYFKTWNLSTSIFKYQYGDDLYFDLSNCDDYLISPSDSDWYEFSDTARKYGKRVIIEWLPDDVSNLWPKLLKPLKGFDYTWSRFSDIGLEVTTKGDMRFSPFFMKFPYKYTGSIISLENYYHLVLKGYGEDGYDSWKQVKGLPPKYPERLTYNSILNMYLTYFQYNPSILWELFMYGKDRVFTDLHATSDNTQARYYADICTMFINKI